MVHRPVFSGLARLFAIRRFSTSGVAAWDGCNSVAEFIGVLNDVRAVDKASQASLERKAMELLSDNLREAAMLLITLKNFGCDVQQLVSRVEIHRNAENLDLFARALAECGVAASQVAVGEIVAAARVAEHPRQVYNYLCGTCILNTTGADVDLGRLLAKMDAIGLSNFTPLQILQIASSLASVDVVAHADTLDRLCNDLIERRLNCAHISDLLEGMSKLSKYYQSPGLLTVFEQTLLTHYSMDSLTPSDLCLALYTLSRYYRSDSMLMDRIAVNLRRDIGNYDLVQLARVILWLSKIGYYNKAIVILIGRMVRTFLDKDSTADAQVLTNLYTGFSRFLYHDKLFSLFSTILCKEEVFSDLQANDAIAIVQSYARVHVVDDRLFTLFDTKLFGQPLNTTLTLKLLVAHGKLRYRNPRLQNTLLNNINLQELDSPLDRERLKLATERLSLFYPELTDANGSVIPRIAWRRLDPERRMMQHVRRRKWTW
ncbi:hypothetical protein X943_003849 [Babesia divergens]|uniref:Uncharacterized protein n=1 Tax=Babesia divergens TaxID=32595 RepID=A0AAD9G7Y3_BABDI|nr:hypothetical protein X943_003849 [Babesia divergens]